MSFHEYMQHRWTECFIAWGVIAGFLLLWGAYALIRKLWRAKP